MSAYNTTDQNMILKGYLHFASLEPLMEGRSFEGVLEELNSDGTLTIRLLLEDDAIGLSESGEKTYSRFLLEGKLHPIAEDGSVLYDTPLSL